MWCCFRFWDRLKTPISWGTCWCNLIQPIASQTGTNWYVCNIPDFQSKATIIVPLPPKGRFPNLRVVSFKYPEQLSGILNLGLTVTQGCHLWKMSWFFLKGFPFFNRLRSKQSPHWKALRQWQFWCTQTAGLRNMPRAAAILNTCSVVIELFYYIAQWV